MRPPRYQHINNSSAHTTLREEGSKVLSEELRHCCYVNINKSHQAYWMLSIAVPDGFVFNLLQLTFYHRKHSHSITYLFFEILREQTLLFLRRIYVVLAVYPL